ncbi:MAG: Ig-like domain-containing protein [Ferruginibacter sp.]
MQKANYKISKLRNAIVICVAIILSVIQPNKTSAQLMNGLVAYYNFDNLADGLCLNPNAALQGSATLAGGTNKLPFAFSTAGANLSGTNYLVIPQTNNLNFGSGSFCVAGWVRLNTQITDAVVMGNSLSGTGWRLTVQSNGNWTLVYDSDTQAAQSIGIGAGVIEHWARGGSSPNNWVFIAMNVNTTTGIVEGYSGQCALHADGSSNGTPALTTVQTNSFTPGGSINATGNPFYLSTTFSASWDELRLWNRVITAAEVAQLYNNGNAMAVALPFTSYQDADGDGYGNSSVTSTACPKPAGYSYTGGDCNDNSNQFYQNLPGYVDADGDGVGAGSQVMVCSGAILPSGYSAINTDCDDTNGSVYRSMPCYVDADNDGYTIGSTVTLCIGATAPAGYTLISPGTDCDDTNNSVYRNVACYVDADNDGYTVGSTVTLCIGATAPAGYRLTSLGTDCNDNNASIHIPATSILSGSTSICNGTANLIVTCTGTGPFSGTLSNGTSFNATSSPITVPVSPLTTTTYAIATYSDATGTACTSTFSGNATVTMAGVPPTTTGASIGSPGTVNLSATGTGTLNWYDAPTGGNLVNTGTSYSPSIAATTSFYVSNTETATNYTIGKTVPATGSSTTGALGLIFSVTSNATLTSVTVLATTVGTGTIQLQNAASGLIASVPYTIIAADLNTQKVLTLNFSLTPGTGYRLIKSGTGGFRYDNTAVSYPYTATGCPVSITASTNAGFYLYFYSWKITAGSNCTSNRVSVTGTISCIDPTVPVLHASSTSICPTQPTLLTIQSGSLNSATSWQWYSGSCGGTPVGTGSAVVSPATTTTYYARAEGGCITAGACASITIIVNPLVSAGTVTGLNSLCIGGSTTFNTDGTAGGTWSSGDDNIATVDPNSGMVTAVATGTTSIVYTINSGCGAPASALQNITVNPTVSAGTITGYLSLCIGGNTTFTSNGTTGGTWSSGDNNIATVDANSGLVTAIDAGTTSIVYTINSGCGSPASTSQNITVNPAVSAGTITGSLPLCIGSTATFISNGTNVGTWSSDDSNIATVDANSGLVTAMAAGTTSIVYTINSGCGSPASASQNITVNPNVSAGTITGSLPLCIGDNVTFISNGTTGGTWSSGDNNIATVDANSGLITAIASGTTSIVYTINSGCGSPASASQNVTVNPSYSIIASAGANGNITATGATTVCLGNNQSYTITATACYHVADVLVDGASVGAVTSYSFNNITANHTIDVNFAPNVLTIPTVTGPVNVCSYVGTTDNITYTFNCTYATAFSYTLPPNVSLQSSTTNSITVRFLNGFTNQANKQIKLTGLSSCGNSQQTIFYLLAQAPVTPQPIAGNTNVCPIIGTGSTYTYTIPRVTGASSYAWAAQAGTTTITHPYTGENDTTVLVSFAAGFTTSDITVRAVNPCDASNARSLTIVRSNPAAPGLISGPTNACAHSAPNGVAATYSIVAIPNAVGYNWTAPAGSVVLHPNGTGINDNTITVLFPNGFTSGNITVSVTNGCGTSTARSLSITKLNPATPGIPDIIQTGFCGDAGGRTYTYTLATMPSNANSLQWTSPAGSTIVSGQGTTSITVSYPSTALAGTITVQASSACASSVIRSIAVKLPACASGSFTRNEASAPLTKLTKEIKLTEVVSKMELVIGSNPSVYEFKLKVKTASQEKIKLRIFDLLGRELSTMRIMPNEAVQFGSHLKSGVYIIEVIQGEERKTERIIKL